MNRTEFERFLDDYYDLIADSPFEKYPDITAYRHDNNKKWFALVMNIPKKKLGLSDDGNVDIVNLKCDPVMIGSFRQQHGIFPAYHMNKANWNSVLLDGSVDKETIKLLVDISYELTRK